MFSRWDFARSAEAIFSRWAVKRVCKFLLKKKLGDFILGDIDLDHLEVQITQGTIHLSDLALNVDVINEKLAGSAVMVKEGSIGSLSIKIPWKLQNCQIEVEELELVLAPFVTTSEEFMPSHDTDKEVGKKEPDFGTIPESSGSFISRDIHEGVKTIAKIVKWFLTSFHVRLRNLIVAFDPCLDVDEKRSSDFHRSLVLRIAEIEYGTCVSEDVKTDCLLGKAKLTNFVKFHGAVVEFLRMEDVDSSLQHNNSLGTSFSEWHTKNSSLGSTATIVTGASDGFSGTLNLSIPWKNGSLDIRKVDADFSVDPIKLRLQPSTIKWIIVIWESLKNVGAASRSHFNYKSAESVGVAISGADVGKQSKGIFLRGTYSAVMEETFPDALLPPRTHVIHNWVPLSVNEEVETKLEQDYGTSIDQFFECFDGMRSSQAGSSGIWNWTCSVFSAISVASNLASGSGHIPIEQQNVETSLRATIAEVSVSLFFHDEDSNASHDLTDNSKHLNDAWGAAHERLAMSNIISSQLDGQSSDCYMSCFSSMNIEQSAITGTKYTNGTIHHLEAGCQKLLFGLQICPQKTDFEASVMHFKIDEYHYCRNQAEGFAFKVQNRNPDDQLILNHGLQREIHCALPPFPFPAQEHDSAISLDNDAQNSQDGLNKVVLLESFGSFSCHFTISSTNVDGKTMTSASFSINMPPFILWIHFHLIYTLLNLYKNVEKYFEEVNATKEFSYGVVKEQHDFSPLDGNKSNNSSYITTVSSRASLQGKVILLQARVILCIPSVCHGNFRNSTFLNKFIALELYPSGKENVSNQFPFPAKNSSNSSTCAPSTSIHLGIGNFDLYLVDYERKDVEGNKCGASGGQSISAVKILSGISKTGDRYSGLTMTWQKGPVTGPWMAGRAWSLASSHNQSRNKVAGKSSEFSSVTAGEDSQETNAHIRQELILSSAFFLHIHFSRVWINLDKHAYKLVNQVMNDISNGISSTITASGDHVESEQLSGNGSQTSILVDCDALNICVILNEVVENNPSIQKELEGSWNSVRLTIEKLQLLSVSNIGGVNDANLFWLNHGEGELGGSILDGNEKARDFLLIACKISSIGRGDGKGANALSFGSAGTTVLYMWNPQVLQSYTSIIVRCGTVVAPGGRMDWVNAICLFFNSSETEDSDNKGAQIESTADGDVKRGSFFLDLVDVALSYEPHRSCSVFNSDPPDVPYRGAVEFNEEIGEQCTGCLLAAASLSISNYTLDHSEFETSNYNIQLKDVGLLLCESSGLLNDNGGYFSCQLRKTGYVKVAHTPLVEAALRIKGMFWEIDCSDSHVHLDTCQDTTSGLVRLVAQLQQLYAPDMEDAIAHLQSRWNTVQQIHNENLPSDVADSFDGRSVESSSQMKLSVDSDGCVFMGLLDEILENAFSVKGDIKASTDRCGIQSHLLLARNMPCDNNSISAVRDDSSISVSFTESVNGSGSGNLGRTSASNSCSPQIIESYYLAKQLPSLKSVVGNSSSNARKANSDVSVRRDIECGKGGWYQDSSLTIVENHISRPDQSESTSHNLEDKFMPVDNCREKGKILLKSIDVRWRMYAGLDWIKPRKESKSCSYLHGRDKSKCLELTLLGLNVLYGMYPDGGINVSRLSVCMQDFHLYDKSKDAPWKLVLGYYNSKGYRRESCAKAFKLDLEVVRPDPSTPIEDNRLKLELLPIRLHLDQGQLNFLISFFGNGSIAEECPSPKDMGGSKLAGRRSMTFGSQRIVEEALLPFFQKCDVKSLVVCVDYIPRHIDLKALRRGNYAELLNLVPWKGIELQLKDVSAVGVYGWGSICETVAGQWLEDISHNQVHKLLKGLAPIKSLFAVGSGTSKLVSLPVKGYRKDQKFLKGMQRGAIAFLKSISLEAVGLGVHLAAGAHEVLLQTEYILASVPPSVPASDRSRVKTTVRSNQPEDAQQGLHQAYDSLTDGLGRTASALVGTPLKVYQRGAGAGTALATAVRAAPAAAIAPVTASARAVHCTLLGVRNSLDPEHKRESREKYLGPSGS